MAVTTERYDKIVSDINNGYQILILMRGLPGSGKSTLAKQLIQATINENPFHYIYSSDDFFKRNGKYTYDSTQIADAHQWNQTRTRQALAQGKSPIIIDNTNLEIWEMQIYCSMSIKHGYIIETIDAKTSWALNPSILARKNTHGVPLTKIKIMMHKYHQNISGDELIRHFSFVYSPQKKPPLLRKIPTFVPTKNKLTFRMNPFNLDNYEVSPNFCNANVWKTDSSETASFKFSSMTTTLVEKKNENKNVDGTIDLIDLTEPVSPKGSDSDMEIINMPPVVNGAIVVTDSNIRSVDDLLISEDSWTDTWIAENSTERNNPKPQRNSTFKNSILPTTGNPVQSRNNFFDVDWVPIDVSISNWKTENNALNVNTNETNINNEILNTDASTMSDYHDIDHAKVLYGRNRDINQGNVSATQVPKTKVTFDKSVMTNEESCEELCDELTLKNRMQLLYNFSPLFCNVPREYMYDVIKKCGGNVNWAAEILLDSNGVLMSNNLCNNEKNPDQIENMIDFDQSSKNDLIIDEEELNYPEDFMDVNDTNDSIVINKNGQDAKSNKHSKKNKVVSESANILKKKIEESMQISNDHYSDKHLKFKKKINNKKIGNHSKEPEQDYVSMDTERKNSENCEDNEDEKCIQFRMGKEFFEQLDELYGSSYMSDESLEPVIHLPISLINQIHALWIESMSHQREQAHALLLEDEEFARQLEAEERSAGSEKQDLPDLNEIVDMELALAYYHNEMSELQAETPEDIATKLTRQKLIEMFHEVNADSISEIFNAHNKSFQQTCEVLLLNTGRVPENESNNISDYVKRYIAEQEKKLLERAKQEKMEAASKRPDIPIQDLTEDTDEEDEDDIKASVESLRLEARRHLSVRNQNHEKAKQYSAKGMGSVASYYSQIAALHAKKYDLANSMAASKLMQLGTAKKDNFTLDLHHLFVTEAIQVLDLYLDKHISNMRDQKTNSFTTVFVVTGRGKHSPQGIPRIKPAVQKRLEERNLRYNEVNRGLLAVYMNNVDKLTSDPKGPSNDPNNHPSTSWYIHH